LVVPPIKESKIKNLLVFFKERIENADNKKTSNKKR
jgi:hypothetical protein